MEREACVCDHGLERSDLCAKIIIIIIISLEKQMDSPDGQPCSENKISLLSH